MSDLATTGVPAGVVWLVGAGPGDPGLITVRGLRAIEQADVIVFDALVNPALLAHAAGGCELIAAGKRAGQHSMPQAEINALLVRLARAGKRVCRLKGGDPFVFGRGGEEALFLAERGVPFEVVAGVSSAFAVPASAGIAVTHRGLASEVHVVTAHEDASKDESSVGWEGLARARGTLVFLMGHARVGVVAERLMQGDWGRDTPAAVVSHGTLPAQRTVTSTLGAIAAEVESSGLTAPAILVVGEAVRLRETLAWFERRPLFGRTIVVTRPTAQAGELADHLADLGAEVVRAPMIRTESSAGSAEMREAVKSLAGIDWVVFTSVNGVEAFFDTLARERLDARALAGVRLAAIGPTTAAGLRRRGLVADLVPARYTSEGLLEALAAAGGLAASRVLLPRADIAGADLSEGLRRSGAEVTEVVAYRTHAEQSLPPGLVDQLEAGRVHLVVFTSASAVQAFSGALPSDRRKSILGLVRAVSIGPSTTGALREARMTLAAEADESTTAALVRAAVEAVVSDRKRPVQHSQE